MYHLVVATGFVNTRAFVTRPPAVARVQTHWLSARGPRSLLQTPPPARRRNTPLHHQTAAERPVCRSCCSGMHPQKSNSLFLGFVQSMLFCVEIMRLLPGRLQQGRTRERWVSGSRSGTPLCAPSGNAYTAAGGCTTTSRSRRAPLPWLCSVARRRKSGPSPETSVARDSAPPCSCAAAPCCRR